MPVSMSPAYQPKRLDIVKYPHPSLRLASVNITHFDVQLAELASDMEFTIRTTPDALALSAIQVGHPVRMFVLVPPDRKIPALVVVNPSLLFEAKGRTADREACLSLPGIVALVRRFNSCELSFSDIAGNPRHMRGEHSLARILQHEQDHLDGILFIDRLSKSQGKKVMPVVHRLFPCAITPAAISE